MAKVFITKSAKRDLLEIWRYIARDDIAAANKVIDALHAGVEKIAKMPVIGHPRKDVGNPNYRFWRVYSYLIAYRVHGRAIYVSRVVHGARNVSRIFKRR
jgi:plasmid stabilization system protein ParE